MAEVIIQRPIHFPTENFEVSSQFCSMIPFVQVMRVYYDRLVDDADKSWLFGYLDEVTHNHLDVQFSLLFHHLDSDGDGKVSYLFIVV